MPYFRYLLAPALEALEAASAATQPRKKRKKKDTAGTAVDADTLAPDAHDQWHLRLQVLFTTGLLLAPCYIHPCDVRG